MCSHHLLKLFFTPEARGRNFACQHVRVKECQFLINSCAKCQYCGRLAKGPQTPSYQSPYLCSPHMQRGGAVFCSRGDAMVSHSLFKDNSAGLGGGWYGRRSTTAINTSFIANKAGNVCPTICPLRIYVCAVVLYCPFYLTYCVQVFDIGGSGAGVSLFLISIQTATAALTHDMSTFVDCLFQDNQSTGSAVCAVHATVTCAG